MSKNFDVKVGDRLTYGVFGQEVFPVWDGSRLRARTPLEVGSIRPMVGEVIDVRPDSGIYTTMHRHEGGGKDVRWVWPLEVPDDVDDVRLLDLWWPRPAAPPKVRRPAGWQERTPVGRSVGVPDSVLARMRERGEAGVRRITRAWPHGATLVCEETVETGHIENVLVMTWYWESEAD